MKGFVYEQSTGTIAIRNGDFETPLASGYAGRHDHLNDPQSDHLHSLGPLPKGEYEMEVKRHDRFASPAIRLTPVKGEMHGRSGFWIHGDNARGDRTASSGCPIFPKPVRELIATAIGAGYTRLSVVN